MNWFRCNLCMSMCMYFCVVPCFSFTWSTTGFYCYEDDSYIVVPSEKTKSGLCLFAFCLSSKACLDLNALHFKDKKKIDVMVFGSTSEISSVDFFSVAVCQMVCQTINLELNKCRY